MVTVNCKWDEMKYFDLTKKTGVYVTSDGKKVRILHCINTADVDEVIETEDGTKLGIRKVATHNDNFTHVGFFC